MKGGEEGEGQRRGVGESKASSSSGVHKHGTGWVIMERTRMMFPFRGGIGRGLGDASLQGCPMSSQVPETAPYRWHSV